MITEEDNKLFFEIDLCGISDSDLVALRNRITWECKRRIKLGIKLSKGKTSWKIWNGNANTIIIVIDVHWKNVTVKENIMEKIECDYIDKDGYCHHPDLCCTQECGIILDDVCGMRSVTKGR